MVSVLIDGQVKEDMGELGKMKEELKGLIKANQDDQLAELELIDVIQQLGLHYHFEAEIQRALDIIQRRPEDSRMSCDLCATALRFRLLRQHGYNVPQGILLFISSTSTYWTNIPINTVN